MYIWQSYLDSRIWIVKWLGNDRFIFQKHDFSSQQTGKYFKNATSYRKLRVYSNLSKNRSVIVVDIKKCIGKTQHIWQTLVLERHKN